MTALNKQALLRAAVKVGAHTWEAEGSRVWSMSNGTADCLVLEVFGDETSGQQDCDIASFIAEASPANILALLYELKESQALVANESDCADSTINLAINWQMRCKNAEAKLEAADMRNTELEEVLDAEIGAWTQRYECANNRREAAEKRNAELTKFIQHIKKCLVKNGEYAPLSHEEIDTLLGIRADGIRDAGIGVKGE